MLLRVDIDKPYGHHSLITKILSKTRENFFFPSIEKIGYLKPVKAILNFLNENKIPAFLFFRTCTLPSKDILQLINKGNYVLGFHAEDTRSFDSFKNELYNFKRALNINVQTFTKHGNGVYKGGKNHYPIYEPEKYRVWADKLALNYSLGNGIAETSNDLLPECGFFKNMFWMKSAYRHPNLKVIEEIASLSTHMLIPIIVHPANFFTYSQVRKDLTFLIQFSKDNNIKWMDKLF